MPALQALNARVPVAAALRRRLPPGRALLGPGDRREHAVRPPAARARAGRRAARPVARPAPDGARRWPSSTTRRVPLYEQTRLASSCQNEVILPVDEGQDRGQDVPGHRPRLPGGRRSRSSASPARAARATPTASGSASCVGGGNFAYPLRQRQVLPHDRAAPRHQPAEADQAHAAAPRRPVRDAGAPGPAHRPRQRPAGRSRRRSRRAAWTTTTKIVDEGRQASCASDIDEQGPRTLLRSTDKPITEGVLKLAEGCAGR